MEYGRVELRGIRDFPTGGRRNAMVKGKVGARRGGLQGVFGGWHCQEGEEVDARDWPASGDGACR